MIGRFYCADRPRNTGPTEWLARRILGGWRPKAIAVAGGISERTAYRWRADIVEIVELRLGEYVAPFAIRRTKPPIRLADWRRTES